MKKMYLLSAIVGCMLIFISCQKDKNEVRNNLQTSLQSSDWKISEMFNHDYECTYEYKGYILSFKQDHTLILKDANTLYYGEWSISDSNLKEDRLEDLSLTLYIPQPERLDKFNNTWSITMPRSDVLKLNHFNMSDGSFDNLEIEKN